jgi:integrase
MSPAARTASRATSAGCSTRTPKEPIAHSTLNQAIRSLDLGVRDFVIHDFRRTASTLLHENSGPSDVVEKVLNHTIG